MRQQIEAIKKQQIAEWKLIIFVRFEQNTDNK